MTTERASAQGKHICCWERENPHRCILCCQCGKKFDSAPSERASGETEFERLRNFFERHAPVLWEDSWRCRCGRWAISRKLNSIEVADKSRAEHLAEELSKESDPALARKIAEERLEAKISEIEKIYAECRGLGQSAINYLNARLEELCALRADLEKKVKPEGNG